MSSAPVIARSDSSFVHLLIMCCNLSPNCYRWQLVEGTVPWVAAGKREARSPVEHKDFSVGWMKRGRERPVRPV